MSLHQVPALLVLVGLTVAGLSQGASYANAAWLVGVLLAVAVLLSIHAGTIRAAGPSWSLLAPLALLGVWAIVRGWAGGSVGAGIAYALAIAGFVVVVGLVRSLDEQDRSWFVAGLLSVGAIVAVTGWLGVILHVEPWGHLNGTAWRAATSITYENAAAGLLVPLALLALGMTARSRTGSTSRMYAALSVILVTGAAATLSRGGAIAALVGLAVLGVAVGGSARRLLGPLAGSVVAAAALLPSIPPGSSGAPLLGAAGLALGLVISLMPLRAALVTATGIVAAGAAIVAPIVLAWLPAAGHRVSWSSTERAEQLSAAFGLWQQHPWAGAGPGRAVLTWQRPGGLGFAAKYVHNEYVQVLVDLGLIGFLLLTATILGIVTLTRRTPHAPQGWLGRGPALAGLAALAVHSLFDFLWHVPVVLLTAAALIGLASMPVATPQRSHTSRLHDLRPQPERIVHEHV